MLVGNLVALAQRNLKRLMAYSSVGHVGYILAGIAVLAQDSLLGANGVISTWWLLGYQHGGVCCADRLFQRYWTGRNPGPRGAGRPAAFPGDGHCHWPVFP